MHSNFVSAQKEIFMKISPEKKTLAVTIPSTERLKRQIPNLISAKIRFVHDKFVLSSPQMPCVITQQWLQM
jgi:hypothetical protein